MKKTIVCTLVFALLLACLIPFGASAEGEPQPISTAAEFEAMSATGSYYLTQDIDFGGKTYENCILASFSGSLDGRGFAIYNFSIKGSGSGLTCGIFATVGAVADTTVKNLKIGMPDRRISVNPTVTGGTANIGVLAGLQGSAEYTLTVESVTVCADVLLAAAMGYLNVGGFIGKAFNCAITDCSVNGSLNCGTGAKWLNVGGLIGVLSSAGGTISGCVNHADITVFRTNTARGAGIVGYLDSTTASTIQNCVNFGAIDLTPDTFTSYRYLINGVMGGIVSNVCTATVNTISDCMNFGTVTNRAGGEAQNQVVVSAGILAWNQKSETVLKNCVNYGGLSVTGTDTGVTDAFCAQADNAISASGNLDRTGVLDYVPTTDVTTYGVQNSEPADGLFHVRFVATLDSLAFDAVGFEVVAYWQDAEGALATKTYSVSCKTVYEEILAKDEAGVPIAVTASSLGAEYIYALSIVNVPATAEWGNVTFVCRSFAQSGESVSWGEALVCSYTAGQFLFCASAQ